MKKLLQLALTFLKIGAFTFGGGYAMIALLENEFVAKKKWLEQNEFIDMVAIAESTPGPIAINSATYIGYRVGGFPGAVVSTFAVSLPSFVIIYIISLFLDRFLALSWVAYAFHGIRVCVIWLILSAGVKMLKSLEKTVFHYAIFLSVSLLLVTLSVLAVSFSSVWPILFCGMIGVAVWMATRRKNAPAEAAEDGAAKTKMPEGDGTHAAGTDVTEAGTGKTEAPKDSETGKAAGNAEETVAAAPSAGQVNEAETEKAAKTDKTPVISAERPDLKADLSVPEDTKDTAANAPDTAEIIYAPAETETADTANAERKEADK